MACDELLDRGMKLVCTGFSCDSKIEGLVEMAVRVGSLEVERLDRREVEILIKVFLVII